MTNKKFTSSQGLELIKKEEGLRLDVYFCSANFATVGYGHKINPKELYISQEKADQLLVEDVKKVDDFLNSNLSKSILEKLNQNQYDAIVSLVFNIGGGAFKKSKAFKYLQDGEFEKAKYEMFDTFNGFVQAGGKRLEGLINRRKREQAIFESI